MLTMPRHYADDDADYAVGLIDTAAFMPPMNMRCLSAFL